MNKIKELWKKQRLTSWHIYGLILMCMVFNFVLEWLLYGYIGYIDNINQPTLEEFEDLLGWLSIMSVFMVIDLIASISFWYEESKEIKD